MVFALLLLDARLYTFERIELQVIQGSKPWSWQGTRWFAPPAGSTDLEKLAWAAERNEREKELVAKQRRFRKLKRAAKRRGMDFEEYLLQKINETHIWEPLGNGGHYVSREA